ncbi:MAG TPA: DUF4350 domain-containing protein [Oculatellaceae cyanobacterium]
MMAPSIGTNDLSASFIKVQKLDRRSTILVVSFVLVSAILGWVGLFYDEAIEKWAPERVPSASTFNKKPSGTSGFMEIVERSHIPCSRWVLPYRQLRGERGTLVVFAPHESLKDFEAVQLLNWVKEGNKLVYMDHFNFSLTRHLLNKLNVEIADGTKLKDKAVPSPNTGTDFSHVKAITLSCDTRLKGGNPILKDASGTVFTRLSCGKGEVVLGTASDICANKRLSDTKEWDNFQFLTNLCYPPEKGKLLFDERAHGYSQSTNVAVFLEKNAPGWCFNQLLLIFLLAVINSFCRFGKTKDNIIIRKLASTEFVSGLASVYQRAKANQLALEIIARSYRTKWCKTTSTSAHETLKELRERWSHEFATDPRMKQWTDGAGALLVQCEQAEHTSHLNDSDFLNLARELEGADAQLGAIYTSERAAGKGKAKDQEKVK